jgi:membrane protein implicated in regulation of membrane protease activity
VCDAQRQAGAPRPAQPLRLLELRHDDLVAERDRLRDARAAVTGSLGPLPASAAIVIGLAGTVAGEIPDWAIWTTLALFAVIMAISVVSSRLLPYRKLRAKREQDPRYELNDRSLTTPESWLLRKIELEKAIYEGGPDESTWSAAIKPRTLARGFAFEHAALNIVQTLFAAIVIVLLVGILTH